MRTSVIVLAAVLGLSGCGGGAGKDHQPEGKQEPLSRIETGTDDKLKHEAGMAHSDFSLTNSDNEVKHPLNAHSNEGAGSESDSEEHNSEHPKQKKRSWLRPFSSKKSSHAGSSDDSEGHKEDGGKKRSFFSFRRK